jgi:hypothetical protein
MGFISNYTEGNILDSERDKMKLQRLGHILVTKTNITEMVEMKILLILLRLEIHIKCKTATHQNQL